MRDQFGKGTQKCPERVFYFKETLKEHDLYSQITGDSH